MDNIRIRTARIEDAEALLEIYAPYVENTAITFEYKVPSPEEFRKRISCTLQKYPYLIAEEEGRIVGYAYASAFHARKAYEWSAETSIYVRRGEHGKGIGRRLYQALEATLTRMGIRNLNACIAVPHIPDETLGFDSVRFHERMGYRMVGEFSQCGCKFGRWYNMCWMEKHIGTHENSPEDVKWIHEIN